MIKIIAVGKIKEKYLRDGINEYAKRLGAYTKVSIVEVPDERIPENASAAQEDIVKVKEGQKLLKQIKERDYVILLDVGGKMMDSVAFSKTIEQLQLTGHSDIDFVIGGSLGHCQDVYQRADLRLSFSPMTLPHQLMRLVLMEQIYRGYKIMRHETYHK
ncbi:MAG: 23S rRNA (pseudouridine(1915)-N(3))-methyltransferase RlmH [Erysipelotrichaceae bacterium]|nr:23S rRNA (pseudouridine(1915)-N(3))-methyltransferase RlmH [Erysipelotrichaceae bacterium]